MTLTRSCWTRYFNSIERPHRTAVFVILHGRQIVAATGVCRDFVNSLKPDEEAAVEVRRLRQIPPVLSLRALHAKSLPMRSPPHHLEIQ